MTDAPNFVPKFGWRKPCPRYIGPLPRPPQAPNHPIPAKTTRLSMPTSPLKAGSPERPQPPHPEPPSPAPTQKSGFPRRPSGPPRNDKGFGLSLRGAKRRGNPHPSSYPLVPRPNVPRKPPRGFQRRGPQASPLVVSRGLSGGKLQGSHHKPAQRLRWEKEEQRNE